MIDITASIQSATTLRDLCDILNEIGAEIRRLDRSEDDAEQASGARQKTIAERLLPELPTYGGPAPRNTEGVWSWDAGSLLVGEGWEFEIVSRNRD